MTLKARLRKAEQHPRVEIVQEMRRLREQGAKPLFEVAAALMEAHGEDAARMVVEMTDAQLLRLLIDSEITPEHKAKVERELERLPSLMEEACRNVQLKRLPPPPMEQTEREAQDIETYLQQYGLRPPQEAQDAQEGYDAI